MLEMLKRIQFVNKNGYIFVERPILTDFCNFPMHILNVIHYTNNVLKRYMNYNERGVEE